MPSPPPPPDGPGEDDAPSAAHADFFDDAYYRVLEPFHTDQDARAEVGALREILGLAQSDRILDLGCGWGRHLALLAGAGHDVVGLDLSMELLRRARTAAAAAGKAGGDEAFGGATGPGGDASGDAGDGPIVVAGDMRRLPLADGGFDVVLNLATSLGLFLEDGPALRALVEARRVLRTGGRLLLEGMHRADVEAHFAPRDTWTLDDGTMVRARRRFDDRRGVSHEVLRWEGPGGAGEKRHSLKVRSARELADLLEAAGFRVTDRLGDWTGEPFGPRAPRLILVARAT